MPTRTPGGEHDYRGIGTIRALRQGCPQVAQKRGGHCGWKRQSKVKVRDRCAWTPSSEKITSYNKISYNGIVRETLNIRKVSRPQNN